MAQLGPDGEWLVQQIDGIVKVYNRYTEEEIVSFDPQDADATAKAQHPIYLTEKLTDEQKCYAHFWCGYFYAHARGPEAKGS